MVAVRFAYGLVEGVPSVAERKGACDRADDRGALFRRLVIIACKRLLIVLVNACPEGNVGDVLLVGDAERLASLVWVAGRVGPELGEGVGSSVFARLVSRVAFGVYCLVDSEDDVAVFERGGAGASIARLKAVGMSPMMMGRYRWRSSIHASGLRL